MGDSAGPNWTSRAKRTLRQVGPMRLAGMVLFLVLGLLFARYSWDIRGVQATIDAGVTYLKEYTIIPYPGGAPIIRATEAAILWGPDVHGLEFNQETMIYFAGAYVDR